MRKEIFILFSLIIILFSCNHAYQYDVYIKNETGQKIEVSYKSLNDRSGVVENTISLNPDDYKRIISTTNLSSDGPPLGASAAHCDLVAEYVDATIDKTIQSSLKWCDPRIHFSTVDIQQGEFTIVYSEDDFN